MVTSVAKPEALNPRKQRSETIRFGVIGYGYWGPNVVRNLNQLEKADVISVCDSNAAARKRIQKAYPNVEVTSDPASMMASPDIDAIAVVTPVWTHYELAKAALEHGKHIFVEKPFTSSVAQAEELIALAEKKNLKIMVDHTFLFTGAVKKIKHLLDEDALGKLYYYDSTRVNLGLFQHDVATGQSHLNGFEDVAFITLYFPDKVIAHLNVNWLSPVKVRTTLIGGEKKMLVWNDLEADEKIKIYDKGVSVTSREGLYNLLVNYRSGDMWAPQIEQVEALTRELTYFVDCILKDETPINDGLAGLRVVKMLEAASESLRQRGALVYL
jgi:predicted dehydrogenase